jgi:hypothetical protein
VKIADNPIFLTQKRLVHRAGVMAAVLIAAILGGCLLAGLMASTSPPRAGRMYYGWALGLEFLVLVWGAFGRVSRTLADDRKAGLWDSNRMTPMPPSQLVTGYWFGSALREYYMGAVLAAVGLVIVVIGELPITLWVGTQLLVITTTIFFGLLGVLMGLAFQRPQGGVILLVGYVFIQIFSLTWPGSLITNFLMPIYPIVHLFHGGSMLQDLSRDWNGLPALFGVPVHPILICVALQFGVGWFLWRAAVRKTANPFQPLLPRLEAVALFALLMAAQHGLIWHHWRGQYGTVNGGVRADAVLGIVHGATMLIGMFILAFASPQPERVRVEALRTGLRGPGFVFARSSVSLALLLAAVAGAGFWTQFSLSFGATWKIYLVVAANLLALFLIFSLMLEFCRLRFQRRAHGFVALGLFVLCLLPFILAVVFRWAAIARFSLLSPGISALVEPDADGLGVLLGTTLAHLGAAAVGFIFWRGEWDQLLGGTASIPAAPGTRTLPPRQ